MKISVIMPTYNCGEYLDRCLLSVVNQSYSNLEILVVDDGSTDTTKEVCSEWTKKDSRIKYIYKDNNGVSSARNLGLDMATGDLIAFVDADDWLSLDMYEKLYSLMIRNNADLVICGRTYVIGDKELTTRQKRQTQHNQLVINK